MKTLSMNYQAILEKHFGFSDFRPGQEAVITALDEHKAALAVFPTGGGKSLCYQLPALVYEGVTVVVSPLIALMKDQIDFLTSRGVDAARIDSSIPFEEIRGINDRLYSGKLKLLYVAPERFNNERFLATLRRARIALFAVDEAHCISEWGHNFRPDYLKLADTARALGAERVLALTATATPGVVKDICAAFRIVPDAAVVTGFYRPNLHIVVTPVSSTDRDQMSSSLSAAGSGGDARATVGRDAILIDRLRNRPPGPTIVYVTLQKTAERVASLLQDAGLPARPYHAGMETEIRTEVQEWWMGAIGTGRGDTSGAKARPGRIVVATIAFGMGIDKADVRYVYHYNLPKSLESYSQEIGRAGRDGQRSIVEMLASPDDVPVLENFAYGDTPATEAVGSLVHGLLTGPAEFDINLVELSNRHDIRQLVTRTALTYLELLGAVVQGTPFYAGYEIRLLQPLEDIIMQFRGEPAELVRNVFKAAEEGRTWYALNPDTVAAAIGQERGRIVRCLEYLQNHGWAELRMADSRMRFTRLPSPDIPGLTSELCRRFSRREGQEVHRLQQVLDLVSSAACITNGLARHFGEERTEPCWHCSYCETGEAAALPPPRRSDSVPSDFPISEWTTLRSKNGDALGHPRQAARFLCGLTSPATTRARLTRHRLFGAMEETPFRTVLAWCGDV